MQCNNTSGFVGVTWDKAYGKWSSRIKVNGRLLNLGRFSDLVEAVCVRDLEASLYHGEFASLNLIGRTP